MAVYLDNNATTIISPAVLRRQCWSLYNTYGNPSDLYEFGVVAKRELDEARNNVAALIRADLSTDKIIFTGCATESNNSVFHSAIKVYPNKRHIVVSAVEHLSVLATAQECETAGYTLTIIPVDGDGRLDLNALQRRIKKNTLLVSIMTANNETGVVFPLPEIVSIVKSCSPDILFHTDAVQAIGKMPIDVKALGVDFLSLSGHKFHAPKGVGALYVKSGISFIPFMLGGHQENNLRAGTENTGSIVAIGEAAKEAKKAAIDQSKVKALRDFMEIKLKELFPDSMILGEKVERLSNTTCIAFPNIESEVLMLKLSEREIYVSTGSACNSISSDPSHVIRAMGIPPRYQKPIRISLSGDTTQEEINKLLDALQSLLTKKGS